MPRAKKHFEPHPELGLPEVRKPWETEGLFSATIYLTHLGLIRQGGGWMNPKANALVEQLRKESKTVETGNMALFQIRRQVAAFGELLVILAEEQEKASDRMQEQTNRLIQQRPNFRFISRPICN